MSRPSFRAILILFILVIAIILFQLTMYQRLDTIERSITKITMTQQHATSPKIDRAASLLKKEERLRKRAHNNTDESATNPIIEPPPPRSTPVPVVPETLNTHPNDRPRMAMARPEPFDAFEGYDNLQVDEVCRSLGKDTIISVDKNKWTCAD